MKNNNKGFFIIKESSCADDSDEEFLHLSGAHSPYIFLDSKKRISLFPSNRKQ
jgi:hypothetical protein